MEIAAGEVHALCGENGAGKSTLIKILSGSVRPDQGTVEVGGSVLTTGSVHASEAAGIAVIHQEIVAFPHLDAGDNIFVGREPRRFGMLDRGRIRREAKALMERLGEHFDLDLPVGELPLAQRQMVGMARALSRRCRLLIMDEPTASLSARETEVLFRIVRQLKEEGVSILYVSHRLEEVFALSDRVTVLRDGRHVETVKAEDIDEPGLIRRMVGRELLEVEQSAAPVHAGADPVLEVRDLSRAGVFSGVSFQVKAGEIVGMSGLVGAGRSEVARAIFGIDPLDQGSILMDGKPLASGDVRAAMAAGVALVPEDRQHEGLVLPMTIGENITLAILKSLSGRFLIERGREDETARRLIAELGVKTPGPELPANALSGGNQQKVVLAKWLATKPRLLILDEPTRGVDVGAKAEVYRLVRKLAEEGMAVLVISSDLPEVLYLSDRILVMCGGRVRGELAKGVSQEDVLALAMPDRRVGEPVHA